MSQLASPPPYSHSAMSTTTLKPYLELPYLLSLAWIAYPILSLVFVISRLQSSADSAQTSVAAAKNTFLASCKAAEGAASSTASFPRYMAIAANQQFTDAVNGTLDGARDALVLSLTAMEAIINFLVDIYRSTFLCFLELIIRGTLSVIISAVQEISSFIQSTLSGIRTSIQSDVDSVNSAIQSLVDGVNKVNPFSQITAPQFSVPSLDSLQNVTIPTDFTQALINLNNSIPSAEQVKDKLNALLDTPFELTKQDITDTFNNISYKGSLLSIPQQSTITFCDQVDTSVIDDLGHDIIKITKIAIIILAIVIVLLILANCVLEWCKWRCLQNHLEYIRQAWNTDPTIYHDSIAGSNPTIQLTNHNLLTLHGITAHPLLMRIANRISAFFRLSQSKHINIQWFFSYVFHPPALACFLIGFVGLLSVQLQLLALGPIENAYRDKALSSAANFSDTIATALNNNMLNQSAVYVAQVNSDVDTIQSTINDGVFGWVNSTTSTLNTTLNNFYGEVQDLVQTIFGGTPLDQPMQDFVFCLLGSKVDALTSALTFMHDNLHVNMPRMNQSSLELSPQDVNDAARPIALAAIGSGNGEGDDGGIVGRIISSYVDSLKKERIMFLVFIAIWGVVVLMALFVIFWHSYIKPFVDRREKRKWQSEQREGFDKFTTHGAIENGGRGGMNLPSFTPLASPRPGFLDTLASPRHRIGSNRFFNPHHEKEASPVTKSTVQFKNTTRRFPGAGLFGSRTMDKENFVIDTDDEPVSTGNSASGPHTLASMLSNFKLFGRKQGDPPRSVNPRPELPSPHDLSIDVDRASNLKPMNQPAIDISSPDEPTSAWSDSQSPDLRQGSSSPLRVRNVGMGQRVRSPTLDNLQQVNAERKTVVSHFPDPPYRERSPSVFHQPRRPSPPPFSDYKNDISEVKNFSPGPGRHLVPGFTDPFHTPFDDPPRKTGLSPTAKNPFLNSDEGRMDSTPGSPTAI